MTLQLAVLVLVTLAAVLACRRAMKPTITPTTTTPSTISLASNISTAAIIPPSPSVNPTT
uniref:Secreted protein n=1 Tax=Elaeophora elaphi TaxID=1147741 RepID=A0A0R3RHN4_9BILA